MRAQREYDALYAEIQKVAKKMPRKNALQEFIRIKNRVNKVITLSSLAVERGQIRSCLASLKRQSKPLKK